MTSDDNVKMNINTADEVHLSMLPDVGKEKAQKIVEYRNQHGPFKNWEDFGRVPGVSKELVDGIKESGASFD